MKDKIEAVKAFHTAFKLGYRETQKANLGIDKNMLRFNLMKEENEEYLEAANTDDLVEVAPAYDVGDITSLAGASLALEMLYIYASNPDRKPL